MEHELELEMPQFSDLVAEFKEIRWCGKDSRKLGCKDCRSRDSSPCRDRSNDPESEPEVESQGQKLLLS